MSDNTNQHIGKINNIPDCNHRYFKRHKIDNVPDTFLNNAPCCEAITQCIESARATKTDVDNLYNEFCNIYYSEMDK